MDNALRPDLLRRASNDLKYILDSARNIAAKGYGVTFVGTEHIILAMLSSDLNCGAILKKYAVSESAYRRQLEASRVACNIVGFTANTAYAVNLSATVADELGVREIIPEYLLLSILRVKCEGRSLIQRTTVYFDALCSFVNETVLKKAESVAPSRRNDTVNTSVAAEKAVPYADATKHYDKRPSFTSGRPTIVGTVLERYGVDLTEKARKGRIDPVIGREKETERIINTLSRRLKNNPLIIGEPGIGKTAIVEGLALKIAEGNVPASLCDKIIYSFDLSSVVAGAKIKGEFEQRFKEIVGYLAEHEEVVLFIDEIHNLVTGAKSDGVDGSEILKPALARGEIRVIGATTVSEYRKYMEKDPALARRFQPVYVDPPSVEDTVKIIKGLRGNFEAHHQVEITDPAITAAVTLSDRYITDRFLPDKAIDLIDEAAARAHIYVDEAKASLSALQRERRELMADVDRYRAFGRDCSKLFARLDEIAAEEDEIAEKLHGRFDGVPYIDGDDVAKVISEHTGIPVARLTEMESRKLLMLEDSLKERVIGQDNAVTAVSHAIRRAMTGVKDPKKPVGVFLFVGPTGVGKTELAKTLADTVFGDEDMLIRIDMSEYMESNSVAKLIGAPPGYVGYDEEGQLTEKVRRKPYSVVLFDEVEKAHRDVFNLFLQIFDDGRLTDSKGRLVDFKNTVIIMTSNLGAHLSEAEKMLGAEKISETDRIMAALKREFRPEFLNRIDDVVPFRRLSRADCGAICRLIIEKFKKRLKARDVDFEFGDDVVELILSDGYDPEYGARQLNRAVTDIIEDAVSEKILDGTIRPRCRVTAYVTDGFLNFAVDRLG